MSGGVDSFRSALLLNRAGLEGWKAVQKNWEKTLERNTAQPWTTWRTLGRVRQNWLSAAHTATSPRVLGTKVFEAFSCEYKAGRTPNPDSWATAEIKFKGVTRLRMMSATDLIATGSLRASPANDGRTEMLKGMDANKTRVLPATPSRRTVAKTMFPVGELEKLKACDREKIRGWRPRRKRIPRHLLSRRSSFSDFLKQYLPAQPRRDQDHPKESDRP